MLRSTVAAVALLTLAACGGGGDAALEPTPKPTTSSAAPSPTPTPTEQPQARLPRGYPKVVPVSSLPSQIRSWYAPDYKRAVAVYPGVWTPLPPGATMWDAIGSEVFDGFCGSKRAFERRYNFVDGTAGTCW